MFYKYKRIDRKTYDFCLKNGYADKALIAKWKKPGFEKLCSTMCINPANFPFGTVSLCRVPKKNRLETKEIYSSMTGCLGCASGKGSRKNIFGNKYGQNLARIQILRERREKKKQIGWLEEEENLSGAEDSSTDEDEPEPPKKKVKT